MGKIGGNKKSKILIGKAFSVSIPFLQLSRLKAKCVGRGKARGV